jgi:hypothetical protein
MQEQRYKYFWNCSFSSLLILFFLLYSFYILLIFFNYFRIVFYYRFELYQFLPEGCVDSCTILSHALTHAGLMKTPK